MSSPNDPVFELAYFPYIGLRGVQEIRFGRMSVWNSSLLPIRVADPALRERIEALLHMNRTTAHASRDSRPLEDIGIVTIGSRSFERLNETEGRQLRELRYALFLCGLTHNARMSGPNAGHSSYTSENFDLVRQTFDMSGEFFAENTGVIVHFRIMGYKVSETRFPKPSYVPQPSRFHSDERLLKQLAWLRRRDRALYRRVMRAAAVFLESYYNTAAVDIGARILLQASAFEILLDLPEGSPRKTFKDRVEELANNLGERRYRYKFDTPGGLKPDARSLKGIWADRFYTLRNHIIHGEQVRHPEYLFRGAQHHLLIAPIFFVLLTQRLIDRVRQAMGSPPVFFDRVDWVRLQEADDFESERSGFKLRIDFGKAYGLQP